MFQKAFVVVGLTLVSFSNGIIFGQIGSLVGALQKKDEGLDFNESQISLIASSMNIMGIFGFGLSAAIADKFGRRWAFIIFSIPIIINWIIMYYAREMYQFMLSRVLAGIASGALWKLVIFVTAEYTSPKMRAFFLNMVTTVAPAFGSCLVHALGIVLHWRIVVLIAIIPAVAGLVLPYFWVESPHWLASRGKFEECQTAFRKLHGNRPNSEKELQLLIKMESTKLMVRSENSMKPTIKRLLQASKRRYFWGLLVMSTFMNAYIAAGGKLIFTSLANVMLEEITNRSDVLLFTFLVDGFIIIGSCMSCFLIRSISMRTMLFSTGLIANIVLIILSACLYFKDGQSYFNWINVSLLALYFILVNAGPYPLLEAIYSEMFPLDLKLYMFTISGVILCASLSLTIFLLPYTVSAVGYPGLFLVNVAIMSASLGYMWLRWPETKGRTLQEIEVYFKANDFDVEEVLTREQSNILI